MAPQRVGFALVAAVLLAASVQASLYRVNPSVDTRTVGMYAANQDTVYLNVSFVAMTDSGEAPIDFTAPELGTMSAELMYAFFPWFAGPAPCPATGNPSLDFTHLDFQVSSIEYVCARTTAPVAPEPFPHRPGRRCPTFAATARQTITAML